MLNLRKYTKKDNLFLDLEESKKNFVIIKYRIKGKGKQKRNSQKIHIYINKNNTLALSYESISFSDFFNFNEKNILNISNSFNIKLFVFKF